MVIDNSKNEADLDGLLIKPQAEYASSLFFNFGSFEEILDLETDHWNETLEAAR